MFGVALEGGGAKGAYHVGAVKALIENGYNIDMITGTSIGALNAAMIVQGDLERLEELWENINFSDILDLEDKKMKDVFSYNISLDTIKYISKKVKDAVKNKGLDTTKIHEFIDSNVDEKRVRKSKIKFGLVTMNLSDKKAEELFIDKIPKGKLVDYLMATSSLPVFKRATVGDKKYLDGGIYDNCPVEMLAKAGCDKVFAIRTNKRNRIRNYSKIVKINNVDLIMVEPVDELVNILNFDKKEMKLLIKQGYFDTLKVLKNLDGYRYYINEKDEKYYFDALVNISDENITKILSYLDIKLDKTQSARKVFFEDVISIISNKVIKNKILSYKDFVVQLVEYAAESENVERYKIYDIEDFALHVQKKIRINNKSKLDKAALKLVKSLNL